MIYMTIAELKEFLEEQDMPDSTKVEVRQQFTSNTWQIDDADFYPDSEVFQLIFK